MAGQLPEGTQRHPAETIINSGRYGEHLLAIA
ncbi:hypothetical protein FHU10_0480 [Serratia fonticola]|jgi:hypothetical protein|uniref:Uncharacterized protein n=1 Tax=Serratia fonticola TaxID=47917 RepID=A0A542BLG7_SERFO|nr:hypothetical protein FHU09_1970 [Serratia fonticola]TQI98535.1 hypothetical protein FHU11_4078 [Serratia fonticola]TVZ68063.1 hypothetical protein FHU10_0480 [Serratia fonticola]